MGDEVTIVTVNKGEASKVKFLDTDGLSALRSLRLIRVKKRYKIWPIPKLTRYLVSIMTKSLVTNTAYRGSRFQRLFT